MFGILLWVDFRLLFDYIMIVYEDDVIGNFYVFEDCGYLFDVDGFMVLLCFDRERMYYLGVSL